jgi:hypothetical protein
MEELETELLASLHDGNFFGLLVTRSNELQLRCITPSGEGILIRLPGLIRLRAHEFLEANTIFEVSRYEGAAPAELLNFVFGLQDDEERKGLEFANRAASSWTLLHLRSSYGCELVALASGRAAVEPFDTQATVGNELQSGSQ